MKKLKVVIIVIIFLPLFSYGQDKLPKDENGNIVYTDVISVDELTKQEIYDKAKFWIVSTLKSGDNMVELSGENSDQIVGTGNLSLGNIKTGYTKNDQITNVTLNFKFIVFCKDGRFKYEISNILLEYVWNSTPMVQTERTGLTNLTVPKYINAKKDIEIFNNNIESKVSQQFNLLIADFLKSMKESKTDDW